ncbi:VOC family protein [Massilia sp. CCM 8733]|uniref:VOC family protein n=1 Tax=Massilia mucilaginosa TaxID=2609282 RepID=A0ABX0P3M3_9BURK|nr:VOC family protein [Massilia mucilaginosa]NHZ93677.1 VOC family protein [Massilia mucilaginosa]
MPACQLDHITITTPALPEANSWVRRVLGVGAAPGGKHPAMGTENMLLRLGDATFLEIIAVDPYAPAPARPRWFALDTIGVESLASLATWVARTSDIAAAAAAAEPIAAPGAITPMARGERNWLITIPDDGSLPLGGVAPALIEWEPGPHPAAGMPDHGLSLVKLELCHPDARRVQALLDAIGMQGPVSAVRISERMQPFLRAHIGTPAGVRILG